jgi:Helix-turn-helix domain
MPDALSLIPQPDATRTASGRVATPDGLPEPLLVDAAKATRHEPAAGLTVKDVARRYRISCDKVRGWIGRGELRAINTSASLLGKPRWVIPPEALAEFEHKRAGGPPPKTPRRRRRSVLVDYFP